VRIIVVGGAGTIGKAAVNALSDRWRTGETIRAW
jgi:nucleoside-diphosphate-sugar epimerase